jgi:hypothetical protein
MSLPWLAISDGTLTAVIADGLGTSTAYKLQHPSWAPAIPELRDDALGHRGPYGEVVEEMQLIVSGATAAACLANLQTLRRLLDNADRWSRGDHNSIAPVMLTYSPRDATVSGTANANRCVIVGRAPGDQTAQLRLPTTQGDTSNSQPYMVDVVVRFRRRGWWLNADQTATAAGFGNGVLGSFGGLSAIDSVGPLKVEVTNVGYGNSNSPARRFHGGFLLVGDHTQGRAPITLLDAATLASGAPWTSVADAAKNADGNVLRYTATSTNPSPSAFTGIVVNPLPLSVRMVAVLANVRNSLTASFSLRARVITGNNINVYTPYKVIAAGNPIFPQWVNLGLAPVDTLDGGLIYVHLEAISDTVGGVLDIDTLVLCDVQATQIISLPEPALTTSGVGAALQGTLSVDHGLGTLRAPRVALTNSPMAYAGDPVIATKGGTTYGLLLVTGGGTGAAGDMWRQSDLNTNAWLSNVWSWTRTRAYLVPE